MKYRNKKTGEIVVANDYTLKYMCENNSNYEIVVEEKKFNKKKEKENDEIQKQEN